MAIGETLLGIVLQVVIDRLASQKVLNFFRKSKFDQFLIHKLQMLMLATEKLVVDAEQKQMTDSAVKLWLEELKHWFYRAEEVTDQIATEALQSSLESELSSEPESLVTKVRNWSLVFSSSSAVVNTITLNIREIVNMLESMLNQKDALGLRELSVGRVPQRVSTTCLLEDLEVCGRDSEKKKILEFLLSEEAAINKFSVFAIVGMGGVGKTAIAKMVYNDARVQETFDLKAWVCVSDPFDISRVTKSILESITRQSYSGSLDLNFLQTELSARLRDKKFLFVLDDAWNEKYEDWATLQAPFRAGATGSKIIITTRNDEVASSVCTKTPLPLKPLSDDAAWSLFSRHAFELGNMKSNPYLECVGRKIVQKCKGLPLALKTLGGLLRWSRSNKDWEDILQNNTWDLPYDKSNVIPALWLSYYHLPGHLKRCFCYCAVFPKGYKIDRKQLVLLWMAENFVQPTDHNKRREDVGDEYLCQLVSRSFLEPMDESHVIMHDLMHDLAEGLSGKFLARAELERASETNKRARHFSYFAGFHDVITKFQAIQETRFLRTFLQLHATQRFSYLTNQVPTVLKPSLSCLRVLSLSGYENLRLAELAEYPKQLRYLDVSRTAINRLPKWVSALCNLQTLILSDCRCLEMLPADMGRLVSLRHLDIRGAKKLSQMPKDMSRLESLQTLTDYIVGKNTGSGIQALRELQQIRGKFAIRQLHNVTVPSEAYAADLSSRKFIDELELEFSSKENDDSQKDREVLENLRPPLDVKRLTIRNYAGTTFPKWLDFGCVHYENLGSLCLSGCHYCITLPPLGQLPYLKKLEIEGMDHIIEVGCEFYGHDSHGLFPCLESLCFQNMKHWQVWSNPGIEDCMVCFPHLKHLFLYDCPSLKGSLPVHVRSLVELRIKGCAQLGGLPPSISPVDVLPLTACPRVGLTSMFDHMTSITRLTLMRLLQLVNLPPEIVTFSSLSALEILECDNLNSLANVQLPPKLRSFTIEGCKVLEFLPEAMVLLTHLREFKISQCEHLIWVPGNSLPTSLTSLSVSDCERWEFPIPTERMQHYIFLESLQLECQGSHLVSFPLGIFPNLRVLKLWDCKGLEKVYIPEGIAGNSLMSLYGLTICDCPKLEMIGKETGKGNATVLPAPNLTGLLIEDCEKVKPLLIEMEGKVLLPKLGGLRIDKSNKVRSESPLSLRRSLRKFSCLTFLSISDEQAECFPVPDGGWGSLPSSLTELWIVDSPKLRKLEGKALQSLKNLQELYIRDCPRLEHLPEEGLPPSLGLLSIEGCSMVEERCQPEKGLDWSLIYHLPYVEINGCCITGA